MTAVELADRLRTRFPDAVVARDEVTVVVDRSELLDAIDEFRRTEELGFDWLSSLTATDWPGREPRFWLAYDLYSMRHGHALRLKVGVPEDDPHAPSIVGPYPTADWQERETYDFYGVIFDGHPDLRRILMPEDWEGYPLRKDHALGGVRTQYKGAFIPPVDRRTT